MKITPNFYPKFNSVSAQTSVKRASTTPSFGHIFDYYDADEIKEARDHKGVFRERGEDDETYERRAKAINDAWERADRIREEKSKPWWK